MKILILMVFIFNLGQASVMNKYFYNKKYDDKFEKYYNKYFFAYKHLYDYKIIKAQAIQESLLNPEATSYVGARGLMQLMPRTYKELSNKTGFNKGITDIDTNIHLGVYYDYKLFNQWKSKRTIESRYKLTFASYNAGLGHLLNSQKLCINKNKASCNEFNPIIEELVFITGEHSKETNTYVKRIFEYKQKLDIIK